MNWQSTPGLEAAFALWLCALGLVIGSFLNVVIARVPHGQSVVRPRSRCPRCGHQLSAWENIPVLSWLLLRGRCRGCRLPISWRYPAVELLTGLLFLAALRRFDWSPELPMALVLICLLIPLTFIDLEHWILPFSLTLPGIAAGLLVTAPLGLERWLASLIGAVAGFFVFWALEWLGEKIFKKEALGGGDKYLLALIGAFLSWKALLGVIFLASLQGALVGTALLLVRGRAGPAPEEGTPAQPPPDAAAPAAAAPETAEAPESAEEDDWEPGPTNIPFGPWLSIAALELLLLGPALVRWLPEGFALLLPAAG
ncbi:prepilin peptidase [Aggregicoccus sp. 17bor-14]|uniref:prepilin peptidase n=1 Tax=Myxococcaceae TaxID=31 RepID=UPI00129CBA67|nr:MULTISPECIES: A24 family peptidase [Myxococcaceae]MBF5044242.1 prepilin peptidase [Simulacricoccus sp. 17bor-14]MRI89992.1 prepilin peptidase [Aggregicoccus sp. 17bor-14]